MSDLTAQEQANVRVALRFLRRRCGSWGVLAKALRFNCNTTLTNVLGSAPVSAGMAIRVARFAGVPIDDVINGKYPAPGTCPYCGHRPDQPTP